MNQNNIKVVVLVSVILFAYAIVGLSITANAQPYSAFLNYSLRHPLPTTTISALDLAPTVPQQTLTTSPSPTPITPQSTPKPTTRASGSVFTSTSTSLSAVIPSPNPTESPSTSETTSSPITPPTVSATPTPIPTPPPTVTPSPSPSPTTTPTPIPIPTLNLTPNPTSSPSSENLAPILGKWGDYHIFGDVCFGDPKTYPQITHADYTTTHNGNPSIRVDGPGIWCNPTREVNHAWVSVKPGDRIIFTCYIKTAYSSVGTGGTIGFDCYGPKERILEVHPRTIQTEIWNGGSRPTGWSGMAGSVIWIPYGSGWTKITLDVTIPYTTYTHNDWQQPLTYGPQQIAGIMPMLCSSWNKGESASIWYSDATLYINP